MSYSNVKWGLFWTIERIIPKIIIEKKLWICYLEVEYNSWGTDQSQDSWVLCSGLRTKTISGFFLITIHEPEIEIKHKTPSCVWDLLVFTTKGYEVFKTEEC